VEEQPIGNQLPMQSVCMYINSTHTHMQTLISLRISSSASESVTLFYIVQV